MQALRRCQPAACTLARRLARKPPTGALGRAAWLPARPVAAALGSWRGAHSKAEAVADDTQLASSLAKALGFYSEESVHIRTAKYLYTHCYVQAQNPQWAEIAGLPDTFMSWFLLTHLHVWLLLCRLSALGKPASGLGQEVQRVFWEDVEHRMRLVGVRKASIVAANVRELKSIFWGVLVAYDEGLLHSDPVLAAALWRNMFDMGPVEGARLAAMVGYVRRQAQHLDGLSDRDLLAGTIHWAPPVPLAH